MEVGGKEIIDRRRICIQGRRDLKTVRGNESIHEAKARVGHK